MRFLGVRLSYHPQMFLSMQLLTKPLTFLHSSTLWWITNTAHPQLCGEEDV